MRSLSHALCLLAIAFLTSCGEKPPEEPAVEEIVFESGWYGLESNETDTWNWAGETSTLVLNSEDAGTKVVVFDTLTLNERTLEIWSSGTELSRFDLVANQWTRCLVPVSNLRGGVHLDFVSNPEGVTPAGDTRELKFCIRNVQLVSPGAVGFTAVESAFVEGWHEIEGSDTAWWRWSDSKSAVSLESEFLTSAKATVRFDVRALSPRKISVSTGGKALGSTVLENQKWMSFEAEFELKPGENVLEFSADQAADFVPGDSRPLSFCIRHFSVEVL